MVLRWKRKATIPLLFLAAAAGCGGSKESRAKELEQKRASWEATARLTRELSARGALPSEYSRQVLQKASQNLEKISRQASQLSQ